MRDVIVIGAGPVGSFVASILSKKMDVVVLEKAPKVGHKACSGLVSTGLDRFVKVPKECIEHKVKGAVMHSPGGSDIKMVKKGTAAYVIDRPGFDRWMASKAGNVMFSTEAKGITTGKAGVEVRTNRGVLTSKVMIDCGGANSIGARKSGAKPTELLTGLTAIVSKPDNSDHVDMWYDSKLNGGFFWKIPRGERTEYGMLGSKASFSQIEKFFRIKGYEKAAAPIPMGMVKTYYNRMLLMGDAACQVKPWSGGGVIYGFTAAQAAARVLEKGDFSEEGLKAYEDAWKEKLAKPITMGLMFREFYKEMDSEQLEMVFRKLKETELNGLDMDFPLFNNLPF